MKKTVPAFSISRQTEDLRSDLLFALQSIVDTQQFIGGFHVETFEKQLASYLGVQHVISCNSGTDALWMALFAMNASGSIVLTTPFSFIASSSEIAAHGAHPVFIDIESDTFNMDPEVLSDWLTRYAIIKNGNTIHKQTGLPISGILPVDIFGQCANYPAIRAIAEKWNLWIIEDAAQSLGSGIHNAETGAFVKAGTLGDISTLSFYPTKNLGAFGDAGACATNNSHLAEKLLQLRHHGRKNAYEYNFLGINSRMDGFQAAILAKKLPHLDRWNKQRFNLAQHYNQQLADCVGIQTPKEKIGTHIFHQYSILINPSLRDAFEKHLTEDGIQTRIFYPQTLQSIPFLQTEPTLITICPIAERITKSIISLPMWPELEKETVDYVCTSIKKFLSANVLSKPSMYYGSFRINEKQS